MYNGISVRLFPCNNINKKATHSRISVQWNKCTGEEAYSGISVQWNKFTVEQAKLSANHILASPMILSLFLLLPLHVQNHIGMFKTIQSRSGMHFALFASQLSLIPAELI